MYDDMILPSFEALVPAPSAYGDWRPVPAPYQPGAPAPRLGPKKKPAKKKEPRFYQLVTRGLA
jgi:hypothetical protein